MGAARGSGRGQKKENGNIPFHERPRDYERPVAKNTVQLTARSPAVNVARNRVTRFYGRNENEY